MAILIVLHGMAGLAVWWALPAEWMRLAGILALAASLAYSMQQQMRWGFTGLELDPDGAFRLQRDHVWQSARVLDAFVTPALTVLRFRMENGKTVALTLLPDRLADDDFRRLRVNLKWSGRILPDTPVRGED